MCVSGRWREKVGDHQYMYLTVKLKVKERRRKKKTVFCWFFSCVFNMPVYLFVMHFVISLFLSLKLFSWQKFAFCVCNMLSRQTFSNDFF